MDLQQELEAVTMELINLRSEYKVLLQKSTTRKLELLVMEMLINTAQMQQNLIRAQITLQPPSELQLETEVGVMETIKSKEEDSTNSNQGSDLHCRSDSQCSTNLVLCDVESQGNTSVFMGIEEESLEFELIIPLFLFEEEIDDNLEETSDDSSSVRGIGDDCSSSFERRNCTANSGFSLKFSTGKPFNPGTNSVVRNRCLASSRILFDRGKWVARSVFIDDFHARIVSELVLKHGCRFNLLFKNSFAMVLVEDGYTADRHYLLVKMLQSSIMCLKGKCVITHPVVSKKAYLPCFNFTSRVIDRAKDSLTIYKYPYYVRSSSKFTFDMLASCLAQINGSILLQIDDSSGICATGLGCEHRHWSALMFSEEMVGMLANDGVKCLVKCINRLYVLAYTTQVTSIGDVSSSATFTRMIFDTGREFQMSNLRDKYIDDLVSKLNSTHEYCLQLLSRKSSVFLYAILPSFGSGCILFDCDKIYGTGLWNSYSAMLLAPNSDISQKLLNIRGSHLYELVQLNVDSYVMGILGSGTCLNCGQDLTARVFDQDNCNMFGRRKQQGSGKVQQFSARIAYSLEGSLSAVGVCRIPLKELRYLQAFLISTPTTVKGHTYLSEIGFLHILLLIPDVYESSSFLERVIMTVIYSTYSSFYSFYFDQHESSYCNQLRGVCINALPLNILNCVTSICGELHDRKRRIVSVLTMYLQRYIERTPTILTCIPKVLLLVAFLHWKFELFSTGPWGVGTVSENVSVLVGMECILLKVLDTQRIWVLLVTANGDTSAYQTEKSFCCSDRLIARVVGAHSILAMLYIRSVLRLIAPLKWKFRLCSTNSGSTRNRTGTMGCRCLWVTRGNYFITDDSFQLKTTITDNWLYEECSSIIIHPSHRIFDPGKESVNVKGFSYLSGDCDLYCYTHTSCENVLHESIFLDHYNGIMRSPFRLMVVHSPTELPLLVSLWRCKMYIRTLFDRGKRYLTGLLESYLAIFRGNQFNCVQISEQVPHGWIYKQGYRSKSSFQTLLGLVLANGKMLDAYWRWKVTVSCHAKLSRVLMMWVFIDKLVQKFRLSEFFIRVGVQAMTVDSNCSWSGGSVGWSYCIQVVDQLVEHEWRPSTLSWQLLVPFRGHRITSLPGI